MPEEKSTLKFDDVMGREMKNPLIDELIEKLNEVIESDKRINGGLHLLLIPEEGDIKQPEARTRLRFKSPQSALEAAAWFVILSARTVKMPLLLFTFLLVQGLQQHDSEQGQKGEKT